MMKRGRGGHGGGKMQQAETLRLSEMRYRRLFETAQDGILILDAETGMVVDVNPFLIELLGFSREIFLGKKIWELGFFKDVVANEANFKELQDKKYIRYEDMPLETADGRLIPVEFVSNVYSEDSHDVIQCNIRDNTEHKRAEAQHAFITALVDSCEDAIISKTLDGIITSWNHAAERLYGYTAPEVLGRPVSVLAPPDQPNEIPQILERLRRDQHIDPFETVWLRKDGTRMPVRMTVSPIRESSGTVVGASVITHDISKRKGLEHVLQESEHRYRFLLENLPQKIFLKDRKSVYVSCNGNYARDLGIAARVITGKTDHDFFPRELAERYRADDRRVMETGVTEELDEPYIQDGKQSWIHTVKVPVRNDTGECSGVLGIFWDITESKRVEEQLLLQTTALANAANAIVITDVDGQIKWVNPAFTRLTGYASEEIIGHTPRVLKSGAHDHSFYKQLWGTIRSGQVWSGELTNRRKDGSLYSEQQTITPVRQNGVITHFIAIKQDITETKKLQRQQQDEAVVSGALARVGQELLSSLDTVALLDRLCKITNEVLGCDRSYAALREPYKSTYAVVAMGGGSTADSEAARSLRLPAEAFTGLLAALSQQEVLQVDMATPPTTWAALPRRFGLTVALYIPLWRNQAIIGVQAAGFCGRTQPFSHVQERIAHGIGQLASVAVENARLHEELTNANRLKSDFVATMSHELRTPLNIITGYTDLLLEGVFGALAPAQADTLQRTRKSASELFHLVEATLDLGRLEAGHLPLHIAEVSVRDLIKDLVRDTETIQKKPGLSWVWNVAPDVPVVHTDAGKLTVVLNNLLRNAAKFTDAGTVTVAAAAKDGGVEIAVSDTGIGIPPEVLPIIFESFRQGESSMTRRFGGGGTGAVHRAPPAGPARRNDSRRE